MTSAKSVRSAKYILGYYCYLLIVWGFYRILVFQFPVSLEILVIKPIIWLIPLFFILKREHISLKEIGITDKKLFFSIYIALILGIIFAFEGILINFIKYGARFNFNSFIGQQTFMMSLFLSFVTAITEELAFRGYIFSQSLKFLRNEWHANLLVSASWTLIHFPIAALDWRLSLPNLILYLFLVFIFSIGACYLFARTKNIASTIFLHLFWQWPIILYR
jgi:membrane protease YdiL (CAAX protease family)